MKRTLFLTAMVASAILAVSCSKDDNPTPIPSTAKEVKELNVSSQTEWVYFSFSEGKQVEVTKQRLQNREKNNAAQFIQSYWEQLSQYNKDGKVDRDTWLKRCRQVK